MFFFGASHGVRHQEGQREPDRARGHYCHVAQISHLLLHMGRSLLSPPWSPRAETSLRDALGGKHEGAHRRASGTDGRGTTRRGGPPCPGPPAHLSSCQFPTIETLSTLRCFKMIGIVHVSLSSTPMILSGSRRLLLLPDPARLGWTHRVTVEETDGDEHCSALRLTVRVLEALPEAEGKEDFHPER